MSNLKIGFYGHSSVCWANSKNSISFIDQIIDKFNADLVNIGVPQGSEERILFDLKKSKEVDVAIIFHSSPKFIFLPNCSRDVSISNVPSRKAKYFWSEFGELQSDQVSSDKFENEFFTYGKIKEVFDTPEEYVDAMTHLKEYFYHPDLFSNRFYSALQSIDNYLENKKIKSYHVIRPSLIIQRPWIKFNSGTVDVSLDLMPNTTGLPNNYSVEQNKLIGDKLINWINKEYGW
jgi:hypothetical protein